MIKLAVALPAYGSKLDVGHAAMWLGFGAALSHVSDMFTLAAFTEYHINGIDLCRNTAVFDALELGADWLYMIDADTFHRSAAGAIADAGIDVLQMIRDAERLQYFNVEGTLVPVEPPLEGTEHYKHNGVGLVGAPVRGRGVGDSGVCVIGLDTPCITRHHDDPTRLAVLGKPVSLDVLAGKMQPVRRIGAACIAVNLNWIRQFWAQGPWFVMDHDYTARPKNARGEDYYICDGIWKRGGLVLCDGRFVPEHVDRRRLVGEIS